MRKADLHCLYDMNDHTAQKRRYMTMLFTEKIKLECVLIATFS